MRSLKLLFKSWYNMKAFFWIAIVLSLAGGSLPFIMHEAFGSEDYMMPKMFIFFPMIMFTELGLICGCRDICANRLMRSMPIAKELYTKAVPTFIIILTVGASAVFMTAYFIFLGVIGAEVQHFSDTLVCGVIFFLPVLVLSPLAARVPGGGLMAVYAMFLPAIVVILIGGDKVKHTGFGLPLWASAAMLAGTLAVGIAAAFWISAVRYKKSNVKIVQQQMPVE
ncbi:MAG: hypothetical protein K2N56_11420 [Oscillospiraceae bacterium]|nr:hypothetical protein [Oscillospiraceae bacterium]